MCRHGRRRRASPARCRRGPSPLSSFFFFQAEDGIRDLIVTGVQTCALPISFVNEVTKDPAVLAARFNAALEQLKRDPHVDTTRIAAIGYCFGGAVVLDMARAGAPLAAVVTFHGALATKTPAQPGKIKARVLVLAGGADPFVPPEQIDAFKREMQAAGARFEVVVYPGAKHGFTNPNAGQYGMEQLAYNAEADQQSWAAMLTLFKEVLR